MPTPLAVDELPELDLFGPDYAADPAGTVRRAREQGGVARSLRGIEILTYERARQLLAHQDVQSEMREYYVAEGATKVVLDYIDDGLLAWIEGDRHRRIRAVMEKAFSLRSVAQQREQMRAVAERMTDRMLERETFDFVADFTYWYPIEVLAELIGVPIEDIPEFAHATAAMNAMSAVPLAPKLPQLEAAITELTTYVGGLLDAREKVPGADLVSALIEAQATLGALSRAELVANLINLLMGGHDTTKLELANCMHQLATHPELWHRVGAEEGFAARCIDESLRCGPAVAWASRSPTADLVADGLAVTKGTPLVVNLFAANRDPAAFADPDVFDPDRPRENQHLAFGRGRHICIGNTLARHEMEIALEVLSEKCSELAVAGEVVHGGPADTLTGVMSLPLRAERR